MHGNENEEMSRFLATIVTAGAALAGTAHAQVLSQWVLTGTPGDQAATAATGTAPGVSGLDLVRGAGINPSAAANSFTGNNWHDLAADDYFAFGLDIQQGWEVVPTELWIATRSSNTGPGNLGLFYSGDGFTTNLHTFVQVGSATLDSVVDLSALGTLAGSIEFRVRPLDATSANGGTTSAAGVFRFADHTGTGVTPMQLVGSVVLAGSFASSFCSGDGSGTPCPCGNPGAPGGGCANGSGDGAVLSAAGTPSVAAGNLVLIADNITPRQPGGWFQSAARENGGAGLPFGDGLRCVGAAGMVLEHFRADFAGDAATTVGLAAVGGATPGLTLHYQAWYRDPLGAPCGTGFNTTNGLSVTWVP